MIWFKRFDHLRFVSISGLGTGGSEKSAPPSPQEMQKRIFDQCSRARAILEKASNPVHQGQLQYGQLTLSRYFPLVTHLIYFLLAVVA